jgi:hypothetical protein
VFGAYLAAKFEDQDFRVITFGCPKPGNSDFMKLFQERFVLILVFKFQEKYRFAAIYDFKRVGNLGYLQSRPSPKNGREFGGREFRNRLYLGICHASREWQHFQIEIDPVVADFC